LKTTPLIDVAPVVPSSTFSPTNLSENWLLATLAATILPANLVSPALHPATINASLLPKAFSTNCIIAASAVYSDVFQVLPASANCFTKGLTSGPPTRITFLVGVPTSEASLPTPALASIGCTTTGPVVLAAVVLTSLPVTYTVAYLCSSG